jgi:hypothetical protein
MRAQEAIAAWQSDQARLAAAGIHLPGVESYVADGWGQDYTLAADAQPALMAPASAGVPIMLTTTIDPNVIEVMFSPTNGERIYSSVKRGTWLDDVILFPVIEHAGEVSSYGDYNQNGNANVNMSFPARQNYLYQTRKDFGDREIERAGLARINLVAEKDKAAANVMNRFANLISFYGVAGLQNYGALNDPLLPAPITPATKTAGGVSWFTAGGAPNATPNEVYNDILTLFTKLVTQTSGLITGEDQLVLALAPGLLPALNFANSFGVSTRKLLKENYPNITFESAVQYGVQSAANPQGVAAGNVIQLFARTIDGQEVVFSAFSERMRTFPIVRGESSYAQKVAGGAWGTVIRYPLAFAQMIGA